MGRAKTHPGPSHVNQELRRLRGCCWPALLQPLVVKGVVDKSCKRAVREEMPGCSNRRDEGLGSPSLWVENRKKTLLLFGICPSPALHAGAVLVRGGKASWSQHLSPHTLGQTSTGTTAACGVTEQSPQPSAKAKPNASAIPPGLLCVITKSLLSLPFLTKQGSSLPTNNCRAVL